MLNGGYNQRGLHTPSFGCKQGGWEETISRHTSAGAVGLRTGRVVRWQRYFQGEVGAGRGAAACGHGEEIVPETEIGAGGGRVGSGGKLHHDTASDSFPVKDHARLL